MYKKSKIPSAKKLAGHLSRLMTEEQGISAKSFVTHLRDQFVDRIERQWFPAQVKAPLSPDYAAQKAGHGLDPSQVLYATGHYTENIIVIEDHGQLWVGIRENSVVSELDGTPGTYPLVKAAEVLEFGSQKMNVPPRPHWQPMKKDAEQQAAAIRRLVVQRVKARLKHEAIYRRSR